MVLSLGGSFLKSIDVLVLSQRLQGAAVQIPRVFYLCSSLFILCPVSFRLFGFSGPSALAPQLISLLRFPCLCSRWKFFLGSKLVQSQDSLHPSHPLSITIFNSLMCIGLKTVFLYILWVYVFVSGRKVSQSLLL